MNQHKTVLLLGTLLGTVFAGVIGWSIQRPSSPDAQALRESEENLRTLLDGVCDHAIFLLDAQGRVASWNTGAKRVKGYSAEQILGQPFARFFTAEDIERGRPTEVLRLAADGGVTKRSPCVYARTARGSRRTSA